MPETKQPEFCNCSVRVVHSRDGEKYEILYCPVHAAAPEMWQLTMELDVALNVPGQGGLGSVARRAKELRDSMGDEGRRVDMLLSIMSAISGYYGSERA